jgi:hypothetical protein
VVVRWLKVVVVVEHTWGSRRISVSSPVDPPRCRHPSSESSSTVFVMVVVVWLWLKVVVVVEVVMFVVVV